MDKGAGFNNNNLQLGNKVNLNSLSNLENKNIGGAGLNKEIILLTVNAFKKFCLKANTKKADQIHDYYIKLEELIQETVIEENVEITKQLLIKQKLMKKIKKLVN